MGIFTNFLLQGFSKDKEKYYSPGTLYEVMSRLGENLKGEQMRAKVKTLLDGWFVPPDTFTSNGMDVPVYALEVHAVNEKSSPRNGYGTYVFVPDERKRMVVVPITSIFSKPSELYDDEDPVKILSALYSDEDGYSTNESLTVYELSCKNEEYYPINTWSKELANDPMEEMFGIFDSMRPGEFAGISIVVVPPDRGWDTSGKMRIRSIEDPEYSESIGTIERMRRLVSGENMPEQEVDRLAGYEKRQLDQSEKNEIDAIRKKITSDVFRCTVRVYASDESLAGDLAGVIMQKTDGKYNALRIAQPEARLFDLALRKEGEHPFLMSSDEIASIWHVPAENTMGDKLHKPLPSAMTPPDELLTINVGDPGDIQKLIYSIGNGS